VKSLLRRVFGSATSREREERAVEVSQLTVDKERELGRVRTLRTELEQERLAAAIQRTVRAVRGGG
jgi:hypothetical protein